MGAGDAGPQPPGGGQSEAVRDDVSILALTKSIFERLEAQARAKTSAFPLTFREEVTVVADESRIAQVIENFVANAVQYTPEGGRITVRIKKQQRKTSFAIENESPPLPEEALHKVWDTFLSGGRVTPGRGTGLGLAIATYHRAAWRPVLGAKYRVRLEFRFTI